MAKSLQWTDNTGRFRWADHARLIRQKYGPVFGWEQLNQLLRDESCLSCRCEIRFDSDLLLPGEFAHAVARGAGPEQSYTIYVHPSFAEQVSVLPHLVLPHLALCESRGTASVDAAEAFAAAVLGIPADDYYHLLCELSAQVGGDELC